MPRICLRLSHPRGVLRPSKCSIQIVTSRTWTSSATTRPTPPQSPRITPHPSSPSSNVGTVPDLCLGAGGKAPGFVQQMLFSAPVQEKQAKEQINQSIRALLGDNAPTTTGNGNHSSSMPKSPSLPSSPYKTSH